MTLLVIRQELEEEFEGPRQSSNYALDGVSTASGAVGRVYHKCTSHQRIFYIFGREMSKTGERTFSDAGNNICSPCHADVQRNLAKLSACPSAPFPVRMRGKGGQFQQALRDC